MKSERSIACPVDVMRVEGDCTACRNRRRRERTLTGRQRGSFRAWPATGDGDHIGPTSVRPGLRTCLWPTKDGNFNCHPTAIQRATGPQERASPPAGPADRSSRRATLTTFGPAPAESTTLPPSWPGCRGRLRLGLRIQKCSPVGLRWPPPPGEPPQAAPRRPPQRPPHAKPCVACPQ